MARLPSSADVPTARVAADPGLQAPAAAFESPLGVAAEELIPAVKKFEEIKFKQDNRRDTVNRAGLINQFTEDTDNERRRLETESDFSDESVLSEYGAFNATRKQEILESHRATGASEDSIANLDIRLGDIESKATGTAAGISVKLGYDKVDVLYKRRLSSLGELAAQDPSIQNLNLILSRDVPAMVDDLRGALDPSQEQTAIDTAREFAVTSAIDPMLRKGNLEQAENLLVNGGMSRFLSQEKQIEVRNRIATIRFNRDQTSSKLSQREKRSLQLQARNFSKELSDDIAAGDVRVFGPDEFGNYKRINEATGETLAVGEEDKLAINEILNIQKEPEQPAEKQPERQSLGEAIEKGTGPTAQVQAGLSNIFGPFMEGQIFKDTTDARQQIKVFSQTAKTALINNPKFPVAEQKIVANLLPNTDTFFTDPDKARSDLNELRNSLERSKESKEKESNKKKITSKRRGKLADQISGIDEILTLMEKPEDSELSPDEKRELEELRGNQLHSPKPKAPDTHLI